MAKLTATAIPQAYVADGAIDSLDNVKGQVLLGPLPKGGQLTSDQFGNPNNAGSVKPSKGKVALAIGVNLTPGVARYITPGSKVDVFVTYSTTGGDNEQVGLTKLFLSNVKVMTVSIAALQASTNKDSGDNNDGSQQPDTQVVAVLDVLPGDAEKLVNGATLGQLYLALSSAEGDGEVHKTQGATPNDVVGSNR